VTQFLALPNTLNPNLMKTTELAELSASEMEAISGGRLATERPRLGGLIVFLLLLLLLRGRQQQAQVAT
jgi:hypothetical protein